MKRKSQIFLIKISQCWVILKAILVKKVLIRRIFCSCRSFIFKQLRLHFARYLLKRWKQTLSCRRWWNTRIDLKNSFDITRVDNHSQTWRSCYDMLWSWWFILAMVWSSQDHGMVIMKHSMIMVWPPWKTAWRCHGDHSHHFNVVPTLIIQPTLLISAQMVLRFFFNAEYVEPTYRKQTRHLTKLHLVPKNLLPKITKSCIIYVILKLLLKKKLLSRYHRRKLWSIFCWVLLTRRFRRVNPSTAIQVYRIKAHDTNYLRKNCQTILFFQKKPTKHDDHTMIMVWIMENMVIIPWSCHESWWSC